MQHWLVVSDTSHSILPTITMYSSQASVWLDKQNTEAAFPLLRKKNIISSNKWNYPAFHPSLWTLTMKLSSRWPCGLHVFPITSNSDTVHSYSNMNSAIEQQIRLVGWGSGEYKRYWRRMAPNRVETCTKAQQLHTLNMNVFFLFFLNQDICISSWNDSRS